MVWVWPDVLIATSDSNGGNAVAWVDEVSAWRSGAQRPEIWASSLAGDAWLQSNGIRS